MEAAPEKQVKVNLPKSKDQIQSIAKVEFQLYEAEGWRFHHSVTGMSSEKEMDQISDKVGIMGLPEVFYGFNHVYISSKEHNIVLDFNAIDSLSYSGFSKREQFLHKDGRNDFTKPADSDEAAGITEGLDKLMLEQSGLTQGEKDLNLVDVIPASIRVEQAKHWENKDTSKIKDFKQVAETSDWTFSTPYKGTVRYLSLASK